MKLHFCYRIALLSALFASALGCSSEQRAFARIKQLTRDDPAAAMRVARQIKDSKEGVRLAFLDFGLYGGETRGISSWILWQTSLASVETELKNVMADRSQDLDRRFEAGWILWLRSNQTDKRMLEQLFEFVREPGTHSTALGRRRLLKTFKPEAEDLQKALKVPASDRVPFTIEKFRTIALDDNMLAPQE